MTTTADLVTFRALAGGRVYAMNEVPPTPTYPYLVIGYAPDAPAVRTSDGSGDPLDRFTVQHFGHTTASVEELAAKTFETFDRRLIDGSVCWQELATAFSRDANDNGVLSITHTYRF